MSAKLTIEFCAGKTDQHVELLELEKSEFMSFSLLILARLVYILGRHNRFLGTYVLLPDQTKS
ncbi:MAG TPA: hypothetical protein VNZ25_00390 [Candidatus Angelobacter sp.]|nr:hypothetical protein [Candidatus Angelobacter sp.]